MKKRHLKDGLFVTGLIAAGAAAAFSVVDLCTTNYDTDDQAKIEQNRATARQLADQFDDAHRTIAADTVYDANNDLYYIDVLKIKEQEK